MARNLKTREGPIRLVVRSDQELDGSIPTSASAVFPGSQDWGRLAGDLSNVFAFTCCFESWLFTWQTSQLGGIGFNGLLLHYGTLNLKRIQPKLALDGTSRTWAEPLIAWQSRMNVPRVSRPS